MKISATQLHLLASVGFMGLFVLLMLWNTVLATSSKLPTALSLLIAVTPLLLPMRGFLRGELKSCAWMAYVSLAYFIHGSAEAYVADSTRLLALLEVTFSLFLFFGSTFYIRKSKTLNARTDSDSI